jgi:hypothetical protein
MKVKERFLGTSLCIVLSSLMLILVANVGPAQASDTQTTGMFEQEAAGNFYDTSQAWAAESEDEEEYREGTYQEQYREEMSEEGEEGSGYGYTPSEEENESYAEEPSDEEPSDEGSSDMPPQGEDDLAHAPPAE